MTALNFYRYLKGYIIIYISGGFCERFINLCNKNGIAVWDITFKNNSVTASIYCKDFLALRPICKKSGVKASITAKKGLRFDLLRHKNRRGLFIGIVFAFIFMLVMNTFVWEIETIGSEKLSRAEIISTVEKVGLHYGTFSPMLDTNEASRKALNLFDGKALWLAINIKGSKATVEIRDYDKSNDINIKSTPSNLIANFDGTLVQSQTNSGVQIANVGETVTKGDILISGISENEDESLMYQRSEGCFTALNSRTLQKAFTKETSAEFLSNVRIYNKISFFHVRIPLYIKSNYANQSYTRQATFKTKVLPFGITKSAAFESETKSLNTIDRIYYIDVFTNCEYEKMENTLILSSDYSFNKTDGTFNVCCDYQCIDFIGKEVPIIN